MHGLHFRRADTSYFRRDLLIPAKQNSQNCICLRPAQANRGWKSYRDALENGKAGKMDTWTASESVVNPLIGG